MHWAFELNKEFCTFYLLHHVLALLYLLSTRKFKSLKLVSSCLALLSINYFTILASLPQTSIGAKYPESLKIGINYANLAEPNITVTDDFKFEPLPDFNPGAGVLIGKLSRKLNGSSKSLTLVAINANYPWTAEGIYRRKVTLKRLNNLFRHKQERLDESVIIVGDIGTGPFTWDYRQFFKEGPFTPIQLSLLARFGLSFSEHPVILYRDLGIVSYGRSSNGAIVQVAVELAF